MDEHYIAQASKGMATAAPAAPPQQLSQLPLVSRSGLKARGAAGAARHCCCCSFNLLFILFEFCSHSICYSMLMTFFFQTLCIQELFILQTHSSCKCLHPSTRSSCTCIHASLCIHCACHCWGCWAWSCCWRSSSCTACHCRMRKQSLHVWAERLKKCSIHPGNQSSW